MELAYLVDSYQSKKYLRRRKEEMFHQVNFRKERDAFHGCHEKVVSETFLERVPLEARPSKEPFLWQTPPDASYLVKFD
jgi:hypothetical protein